MGLHSEQERLSDGRVITRYYETDSRGRKVGSPVRTDYENSRNLMDSKTYNETMDAYYSGQDADYENRCTCGGIYEPAPYQTRNTNTFGFGRKATVSNGVKCNSCGRRDHV